MNASIEAEKLIEDWNFIRGNTIAFLEALNDEQLKANFPRPGLNSFLKQFQEMVDVQEAYLDACESGVMTFEKVKGNDDYENNVSHKDILQKMKSQDLRVSALLTGTPNAEIVWEEDDKRTIFAQMRMMCMHEALHIGQLVAFSYTLGLDIPSSVIEAWALS